MSTEVRQIAKRERTNGATIQEIMHPLTKIADPSSLLPSEAERMEMILSEDRSEVRATKGVTATVTNKVQHDLLYAARLYDAFEVDPDGDLAPTNLQTAIDTYEETPSEGKDSTEIEQDVVSDTINALRKSNAVADQILVSFVRSSTIKGLMSLEVLALYLNIKFTVLTTDIELCVLIADAL